MPCGLISPSAPAPPTPHLGFISSSSSGLSAVLSLFSLAWNRLPFFPSRPTVYTSYAMFADRRSMIAHSGRDCVHVLLRAVSVIRSSPRKVNVMSAKTEKAFVTSPPELSFSPSFPLGPRNYILVSATTGRKASRRLREVLDISIIESETAVPLALKEAYDSS
ncbi:hypothetical protein M011DRAFT_457517 [Sporormia fimetaria CBS 119925]|uniref:Uncharacterized protein n=1 Tax=Sporormia fimetaria CBS 119925 TaxID=1340428 RepID=A0A6A6VGF9_9PLEO|nr:hypothetical protein M011DRAFT_457517 [Sporormia fimetaria CBS 119925]